MPIYMTRVYISTNAPDAASAQMQFDYAMKTLHIGPLFLSGRSVYDPIRLASGAEHRNDLYERFYESRLGGTSPGGGTTATPAPAAGSTQSGTQPTPTKSFHMPNLKPRSDMGGLMGSG